jgi:hypothetical protein
MATSYTASGVYTGPAGEVTVLTKGAQPISFYTNDTQRGLIDANGVFVLNNTGPQSNERFHLTDTAAAGVAAWFSNNNAAPTTPIIHNIVFIASAPNNASAAFTRCHDTGGIRKMDLSNGGISNYAANNVNLSDASVKGAVEPYDDTQLDALQASFLQVNWGRFKYLDQTHTDWNHGYTAQGVEEAFALTAPELVDETEIGTKGDGAKRKGVYDSDLTHIAMALLARALARIAALEAKTGLS